MKITHQSILAASTLAIGVLLGASALVALADFTSPHSAPPTCITDPTNPNYDAGCLAPINVGAATQSKTGLLGLNTLSVNNLYVASGTPSIGAVLTSDAVGNASWQAPAAFPVCGSGQMLTNDQYGLRCVYTPANIVTFSSSFTWNKPTGITGAAIVAGGPSHRGTTIQMTNMGGLVEKNNIDVSSVSSITGTVGGKGSGVNTVVNIGSSLVLTANSGDSSSHDGTASGGDENITGGNTCGLLNLSCGGGYVTITFW
jgi:hypothetical protein